MLAPLVHLHDARVVAAPVAVVRTTEDRHTTLVVLPVVTLLRHLVTPSHELKPVRVVELSGDVSAECVPCATLVAAPTLGISVESVISWVRPQQVTQEPILGRLLYSVGLVDLLNLRDCG